MADSYGNVTVHATATEIVPNLTSRRSVLIYNNGTNIVYLGFDASVTTANGIPLLPQASNELSGKIIVRKKAIYGISASGDQDIRYMYWND